MLSPNPSKVEYGTCTTSRKLEARVPNPDPHTIPTCGFRRCVGTTLERMFIVAENGNDLVDIVSSNLLYRFSVWRIDS